MITLDENSLSFTFPEISDQLHPIVEATIAPLLLRIPAVDERRKILEKYEKWLKKRERSMQAILSDPGKRTSQLIPVIKKIQATSRFHHLLSKARSIAPCEIKRLLRRCICKLARFDSDFLPTLTIKFHRTLRVPDNDRAYPLPAGLGRFPLHSVDDFSETIPSLWKQRGGIMLPIYQSEALWMEFSANYPFALKIGTGKINAVSGEQWSPLLQSKPQNYVVIPEQPWLDGFSVGDGVIRQFVAMPLGAGYSVEEQLNGKAEFGGIQFQAFPMRAECWFQENVVPKLPASLDELYLALGSANSDQQTSCIDLETRCVAAPGYEPSMGLGAGGTIRQEIYTDPHHVVDWEQSQTSRCFVHLCNSLIWRQITGANPPHPPLTALEYKKSGIPWFDYYRDDLKPLKGSNQLAGAKSIAQVGEKKNSQPLPENTSIAPEKIIQYGNARRPREIREFMVG